MKIKTLSRSESKRLFEEWMAGEQMTSQIPAEYQNLGNTLRSFYCSSAEEAEMLSRGRTTRLTYLTDVLFGLKIYELLDNEPWFTMRTASDYGFWRYLNVMVVPDILKKRWKDETAAERYYSSTRRLYLSSLWWFIYLSWQGNMKKTRKVLLSPNMNTDTILNLVERPGKLGTYAQVTRWIMYYYSYLKTECVRRKSSSGHRNFFRALMKLNTAKIETTDPLFFSRGPQGYVSSLFVELGIRKADFDISKENTNDRSRQSSRRTEIH